MGELQDFVADLLERNGAVVEALGSQELEVLAPPSVRTPFGWPELARLGFGAERSQGAIPIGLEGDWIDRFTMLLHDKGRWSARDFDLDVIPEPSDPQRVLDRALDLPNATCRLQNIRGEYAPCLILTFRYTAVSDEKREGLIWLGFNTATCAVINDLLPRLRPLLAQMPGGETAIPETVPASEPGWGSAEIEAKVQPLLVRQVREEIEPFLRAMQRRLARDSDRVHAYHEGLHAASGRKLAALSRPESGRTEADERRETMRIEAIEREYHAKIDDLRRNYALRVGVEWVQALKVRVPVRRLNVLVRRRKSERVIQLDWHALIKAVELPLCEAGIGGGRVRLVCDENLHVTAPAGQDACTACAKPFCRACFPNACPRCGASAAPRCD